MMLLTLALLADVVVGSGSPFAARYYYLDGDDVVRTFCEPGSEVFDHDTCGSDPQRASKAVFAAHARANFGVNLDEYQRRLAQVWARLQQIDGRLLEMLSDTVPAGDGPTLAELEAKLQQLVEQQATTQAHRDQMARLRERLAQAPGDVEILAQIELRRASMGQSMARELSLQEELEALRSRYYAANDDEQGQDYHDLKRMQQQALTDVDVQRSRVSYELYDLERIETWLRRVEDGSLAWTLGGDGFDVDKRFDLSFRDAEKAMRSLYFTSAGSGNERYVVRFEQRDARVVEEVRCRVSTPRLVEAGWKFRRTNGDALLGETGISVSPITTAGTVEADSATDPSLRFILADKGFIAAAAPGTWEVTFLRRSAPLGPDPTPFANLTCQLVFAR